jgi:DNA-directed RNA polymerase subunit F
VAMDENEPKPVSLSEVKNILKKVEKDRKELLYEQKIALEHANKFAKLTEKKTKDLIKDLKNLEFIQEVHAYKIADILPTTEDDIKTIFAKERITLKENDIKSILDIIKKHYIA